MTAAWDKAGFDPWQGSVPSCRLCADSPRFRLLLGELVGGALTLLDSEPDGEREAVLVDCRHTADALLEARRRFPARPLVGVIAQPEAARMIEVLARGAEGVVALNDPPEVWRECLHVVLGGGRWLGGPGLDISLDQKYASYEISRGEQSAGDVTLRTRLFVRGRLGDRFAR